MSNFTLTIILAFGLIVMALIGVGIGWLITGKTRVRHCGMRAPERDGKPCKGKASCPICESSVPDKETPTDSEEATKDPND